jgi:hypothetical protein
MCDKRLGVEAYHQKDGDPGGNGFRGSKWLSQMSEEENMGQIKRLTSPIPSPSVAENVKRIWIVGSKKAINLSSVLRDLLEA